MDMKRDEFETFLREHADRFGGAHPLYHNGTQDACPLARWLASLLKREYVLVIGNAVYQTPLFPAYGDYDPKAVLDDSILEDRPRPVYRLPAWAIEFQNRMQRLSHWMLCPLDCLEALERVPYE